MKRYDPDFDKESVDFGKMVEAEDGDFVKVSGITGGAECICPMSDDGGCQKENASCYMVKKEKCTTEKMCNNCYSGQGECLNRETGQDKLAEKIEESRISGRTEAVEFIGELVGVYRENGMDEAADMLDKEIDNFAHY